MCADDADVLTFYDNAFSPFARKARMVLEYKGIDFDVVDGLKKKNRNELEAVNGRVEVPALDHDGVIVANSADIVGYLERAFPSPPVFPSDPATWAKARAWERCADTLIDAIWVDLSLWLWQSRTDPMPEGMHDAARADMAAVYAVLEAQLTEDFVCGALSIADISLFAHMGSLKAVDLPFDPSTHPRIDAWYRRCQKVAPFAADLERRKRALTELANASEDELDYERDKIFWRGDRIEWVLARGYHAWFIEEIEADRVIWPGRCIP